MSDRSINRDAPRKPLKIIANIAVELVFFFALATCLDFVITRNVNDALYFALKSTLVILLLDIIIYFQKKQVGVLRLNIFK